MRVRRMKIPFDKSKHIEKIASFTLSHQVADHTQSSSSGYTIVPTPGGFINGNLTQQSFQLHAVGMDQQSTTHKY